jgi:hypothetical protein
MRLINKLKKLIGMDVVEYDILYTNTLSLSQRTRLMNNMFMKFPSNCRPSRVSVGQQSVSITMSSACLTGEQLKKVSDDTLSPDIADITSIKLNGDVIIWSKK